MITGVITILLSLALLLAILYDYLVVKNQKIDAVFGNPERANGGYHWIVAGSCSILLLWLYFSWDIARSFYPQSANELCQVAKVRESLVGINYIFPIEQRTLKSTAFIERETKKIRHTRDQIIKSKINAKSKEILLSFLDKSQSMIVALSDEKNIDETTLLKIDLVAGKIFSLSKEFQTDQYPPKKRPKEEVTRLDLLKKQTAWGATGMEIPPLPETKRGLKFEQASIEMNAIVEEFFKIKNDNYIFLNLFKTLNEELKNYKASLLDNNSLEYKYHRQISKISGRIGRSNIFPSSSLNKIENAVTEFNNIQISEQGGLRLVDIFLFPSGTIVASGETCSEQGAGRWLPKPTDTLKIFLDLLKPSVGYKNFPMLWYQFIGFNEIVDFFIPDWVADLFPGKYPVHSSIGKIEPNIKKHILNIVSGEFNSFKIPVPSGHIWDSFLRVFLGLSLGILAGVPLGLFMGLSRFAKGYFDPVIELYRPVPPLAWAPLIITVFGIDNSGKVFLLFMVSFAIMIVSARAGASGTQLSKIHAAHSLGASRWQILSQVIFPNSLPEILTGIRVAIGVCWGTLVAAEFLAGTTGIGFVENVARKYMQYEHIWITIFVMGMLGLFFDLAMRWIIKRTIPWRGKG